MVVFVRAKLLATNREHVDTISALAFSPDGQILFSGSDDQSIILSQIVLSSQQMEGDDGYTVTTADMYTVRQKHKSDLHANRVVDIHTPNNTTVGDEVLTAQDPAAGQMFACCDLCAGSLSRRGLRGNHLVISPWKC